MKHVARHAFDPEVYREFFPPLGDNLQALLGKTPSMLMKLASLGRRGLELIQYASVFEREHPLLGLGARTLGQARLGAVLIGAGNRGEPTEFSLGERRVTMQAAGPNGQSGVTVWINGWYGALMARDTATLDGLRQVSSAESLRTSASVDAYHYAWKDALAAADSQPEQALAFVERALTLTKPEFATIAAPGVPELDASVFPILRAVVERNAAGFNDALVAALQAHKARWSNDPFAQTGWIALDPLALACLAHDRGIPIEVESDYLLPALIRGA